MMFLNDESTNFRGSIANTSIAYASEIGGVSQNNLAASVITSYLDVDIEEVDDRLEEL